MMAIKIYNTLTQQKETFTPVHKGRVGIYLCGPTVYKPSHIGHAVGPVIFDTIKRYLSYRGYQVTWVVNITDVEDKLVAEAQAQGCTSFELAERVTASYLAAMDKLGVRSIDHMPKASEHIGDIIDMCQRLIDKEAAYASNGDVYFDITACKAYGKLSHRKADEQQSGMRTLAGESKRHPGDFALWKASKPDEPEEIRFDSPWGKGRPGWHIECSAMSARYLGTPFDIHGGGMDLVFPHHENEIAQSETCFDTAFANYWMHNGLTRFNTKKISKSDADMARMMEQLTLDNLLDAYPAELLRFLILSTHYRRPIEFSEEEIAARQKGLETFHRLCDRVERLTGRSAYEGGIDLKGLDTRPLDEQTGGFVQECLAHRDRFVEAMDDDFNTAAAIGVLFELASTINRFIQEQQLETQQAAERVDAVSAALHTLRRLAGLLGVLEQPPAKHDESPEIVDQLLDLLVEVRSRARRSKQFELSDTIRDRLGELGIQLEDRADGTLWRRAR
jgi:cysteinyl-tRNA synthetase